MAETEPQVEQNKGEANVVKTEKEEQVEKETKDHEKSSGNGGEIAEEPEIPKEESVFLSESEANLQFLLMAEGSHTSNEAVILQPELVCTIHQTDSKGELRSHPFYYLQFVKDPGIYKAFHGPDTQQIFTDDGQDKYKYMCEVMNSCFLHKFHRELVEKEVDLKILGISSSWMRAMCEAMWNNKTVEVFTLAKNWLNTDACFHLGILIMKNKTISELNISGCHIGMEGMRRLVEGLEKSKKIKVLNLDNNDLGLEGLKVFAPAMKNEVVECLSLASNKLDPKCGFVFFKNMKPTPSTKLSTLDVSYNFLANKGINSVLKVARKLKTLQSLNISWNNIESVDETANLVGKVMQVCRQLKFLDISHNFFADSLEIISSYFPYSSQIEHMKIGWNFITPDVATIIIENFMSWRIKMKILDMENTNVLPLFEEIYKSIKVMRTRKDTTIIYETVLDNYKIKGPNVKDVAIKRARFLAGKKNKSFGSFVLRCQVEVQGAKFMNEEAFAYNMKREKLGLDKDLIEFLIKPFYNKKNGINIKKMADAVLELWPNTTPKDDIPPPPPVVKKQIEEEIPQKGKKKGKGGKKKK